MTLRRSPGPIAMIALTGVLLSGCSGPDPGGIPGQDDSTQGTDYITSTAFTEDGNWNATLLAAIDRFNTDLGEDGAIRDLKMTLGSYGVSHQYDFGSNDVNRYTSKSPQTGETVTYCSPEDSVWVFQGEVYTQRVPDVEWCAQQGFDGLERDSVTRVIERAGVIADGGSLIVVQEGNATGADALVTYILDEAGRITVVVFDDAGLVVQLTPDYGARKAIDLPAPTARFPETVYHRIDFSPGNHTVDFLFNGTGVALDEFEVRIQDDAGASVAVFAVSDPEEQSGGGFTFRFTDSGDGVLGQGDSFVITNPDWRERNQYDPVVWDRWADRPINFDPVCGADC